MPRLVLVCYLLLPLSSTVSAFYLLWPLADFFFSCKMELGGRAFVSLPKVRKFETILMARRKKSVFL